MAENEVVRALRGRVLAPLAGERAFKLHEDAVIEIDEAGRITAAGPAPEGCAVPITHPGAVLLPGFVDAHVHYPQTRVLGSASGPLLDWLARSIFPEEARFADAAYARAVAEEMCDAMLAQGTTCAAIYGSSHPGATEILFSTLAERGLRALAGMTLMDRGAPAAVLLEAEPALEASRALAERWDGHDEGRLRYCVTPRFALSCTEKLLRGAAELSEELELPFQTHISENRAEIVATAEAFPGYRDYLDVYAGHGLLGPRGLFAHCIWLEGAAWDRFADAGAAVAHCPDSNFFLGSGQMDLREPLRRGIRVGLGTDVGAGRSFSLRRIAASAYDTALLVGGHTGAAELLWLATVGGARALGLGDRVGLLEPGYEADVIALAVPAHVESEAALLDALAFARDAGPALAAYVRGRRIRVP